MPSTSSAITSQAIKDAIESLCGPTSQAILAWTRDVPDGTPLRADSRFASTVANISFVPIMSLNKLDQAILAVEMGHITPKTALSSASADPLSNSSDLYGHITRQYRHEFTGILQTLNSHGHSFVNAFEECAQSLDAALVSGAADKLRAILEAREVLSAAQAVLTGRDTLSYLLTGASLGTKRTEQVQRMFEIFNKHAAQIDQDALTCLRKRVYEPPADSPGGDSAFADMLPKARMLEVLNLVRSIRNAIKASSVSASEGLDIEATPPKTYLSLSTVRDWEKNEAVFGERMHALNSNKRP